jgi:glycosyltransferase involved in cell wall biosynthesis
LTAELPLHLTDADQKLIRARAHDAGLKTAAVFHDTIPWKMRDIYPEPFARAHLLYMHELWHYDRVIAVSRYSQDELVRVMREDLQLSDTFPHVLANPLPAEFPERSDEIAAAPGTREDGRPIEVLCVGTIEPRKNHERMLAAFERASRAAPVPMRLTLVGGRHNIEPDLALRVRARVDSNPAMRWEEKADDARIRQLYRQCDFTIYPSIEEGFGIPILESLWYGKPVITASFGAMSEAAEGGGCLLVDTRDVGAMSDAITQMAESNELRARLSQEAKARSFRTWRDFAADLAEQLGLWTCPDAREVEQRRLAMGLTPATSAGKTRGKAELAALA